MIRNFIRINSLAMMALAVFFFIYPALRAAVDLRDPALRQPGTPGMAWRLFRNLTPRYAAWARGRVAGGRAEKLSTDNISGTEWPLFGSVFYLWATENLQDAWDAGDDRAGREPREFARETIVAASELVVDPKHASWVKQHWGQDYLHREDAFYRMLVMAALTSREKLLHDGAHLDLLRDQVETFSKELNASKTGLLEDYPGECYPGDVMAALMCIRRADAVLGTNHMQMINRALRGFIGAHATRLLLPPYSADAASGRPTSEARGCANSYMCLTSPELWPGVAQQWYAIYDEYFWQERFTAAGYREFPKDVAHSDWMWDVDAGPVVAGFGVAANAFGVGAARKNGRFDRAYPLSAELLATVGELPNGVLAGPRLLSNFSDAPYLGEAAVLWQLSVEPQRGFPVTAGGSIPVYVYIVLIGAFLFGAWRVLESVCVFQEAGRPAEPRVWAPRFQVCAWIILLLATGVLFWFGHGVVGTVVLVLAVALPVTKPERRPKGTEGWPEEKPPSGPQQGAAKSN